MFGRSLNKYTSNERKPVQIFPWVDKKIPSLHLAHKWNSFFLKHQFWCVHEWSCSRMIFGKRWPFLVTKSSTFEGSKKALLFCHKLTMEFFVCITFATELVHKKQKKIEASTHCCFWKKQSLKWQWKEDKIICGKANSYFRRLSGPFRKNEEISKVVYFFSFGLKLKMKLVETVSVSIGVKFRQTSYASKTN